MEKYGGLSDVNTATERVSGGQIGLYEGIIITGEIEELLDTNPSDREIKKVSHKQGILDMREDGILKILSGVTTIDELYRVVDMSGER